MLHGRDFHVTSTSDAERLWTLTRVGALAGSKITQQIIITDWLQTDFQETPAILDSFIWVVVGCLVNPAQRPPVPDHMTSTNLEGGGASTRFLWDQALHLLERLLMQMAVVIVIEKGQKVFHPPHPKSLANFALLTPSHLLLWDHRDSNSQPPDNIACLFLRANFTTFTLTSLS